MSYVVTLILSLLVVFICYINRLNIASTKDTINVNIFNWLSLLFILIFIYYAVTLDLKNGMFTTFIIWCLFVVATPITNVTMLVSVPAKNIFSIDLDISQYVASFVSLVFIFYSYYNCKSLMKASSGGRFLIKVIDAGSFIIFATCIIASISMAYLLNELIDCVIYKRELDKSKNLMYFLVFIASFIMYFISLSRLPK